MYGASIWITPPPGLGQALAKRSFVRRPNGAELCSATGAKLRSSFGEAQPRSSGGGVEVAVHDLVQDGGQGELQLMLVVAVQALGVDDFLGQ